MIYKGALINTIKISTAAILSIIIAISFDLNFAISSGVVAILSIQPTKKETVKTAFDRFIAFIAALAIAFICFEIAGYTLTGFCIYLFLYILICQIFRWYKAMTMSAVLISHFLTAGNMEVNSVINELLIFIIGVSMGILANIHLRKNSNYIEKLKEETDARIKKILCRMSERILDNDVSDYNAEGFVELENSIRNAKNIAEINYNNQLRKSDIYDIEYIHMRDSQCKVLYEMYKNVRHIQTTPITAQKIASFLFEMSQEYHQLNTGRELLQKFRDLDNSMKTQPLPTERIEFEDRAKLYSLLRYIEEFIEIKVAFAEKHL